MDLVADRVHVPSRPAPVATSTTVGAGSPRRAVDHPRASAVALLDDRGRIVGANQALVDVLGICSEGLEGLRIDDLVVPAADERSRREGLAVRRPDGELRWVQVSCLPLGGQFELGVAALLVLDDVSARHQFEADSQTRERLESMGRLAAGVAHEINTPTQFVGDNVSFLAEAIDSLLGVIDVLVEDLRDSTRNVSRAERVAHVESLLQAAELDYFRQESPQAVAQAQSGVKRIATIVRAMKALGHPDQDSMALADLDQCLRDAVTVTRGSIKQVADVALDLGGLPPVMCMAGAMGQVFMNLIINAADAIRGHRSGTPLGLITITSRAEDGLAVITLTDDGGGIPPAIQDRVFEPYFTTKDVGQGTGQGLALAYRVVSQVHRGSLAFDTTPGVGTTFTVRVPIDGPGA